MVGCLSEDGDKNPWVDGEGSDGGHERKHEHRDVTEVRVCAIRGIRRYSLQASDTFITENTFDQHQGYSKSLYTVHRKLTDRHLLLSNLSVLLE